jgi:hypothetical protein
LGALADGLGCSPLVCGTYLPQADSRAKQGGIRSLTGFGKPFSSLAQPVLYLRPPSREAIPQYISGRTSYHESCLAFHSYPQLIRQVFTPDRCGPPQRFSLCFTLAMDRSTRFGSISSDLTPYSDSLSLRLRLLRLSLATEDNSPAH